jgi:threonine/homoserine efflux transporter RhtA
MEPGKPRFTRIAQAAPPHAWFGVSAVFHYLGPSFAVLLFPAVGVPGVAWLRIASAAGRLRRNPFYWKPCPVDVSRPAGTPFDHSKT